MKEIYIFGAGASHASAGTPLGKDLVWNYCADCCSKTFFEMGNHGKPTSNEIEERNREIEIFKKWGSLVANKYPEFKYDFERITKEAEYSISNAMLNPTYSVEKAHYIDEFLEQAFKNKDIESINMTKNIIYSHLVESCKHEENSLYKLFITNILKNKSIDGVAIISFNFDPLLHEYYTNHNPDGYICIDYMINFDNIINRRGYLYKNGNGFMLLKLNGSIDWGICQICKRISLYSVYLHKEFYENQICKNNNCGGEIEPYFFVPHEKKENSDIRIIVLWELAKKKLMGAEKITIIGYSFPEYDTEVLDLLRMGLKDNNQLKSIDIVDFAEEKERISITEKMRKKYKNILNNDKVEINIMLNGFEGYLKSLG
jgi:hypothetical protein